MSDISPGQALIYSVVRNNNLEYKFKLYNGEEGNASLSVLDFLKLNAQALPAVVSIDLLTTALYKNSVSASEVLTHLMQKADTEFVKKLVQTRVSIDRFREFVAKVPTIQTVTTELLKKADLEYVNSALGQKVDRGQVYTIDQIHEVLLQFLGSRAVYNIAERDALNYAMNPFVWVMDASDDTDPNVKSPALYKWNIDHWVYLGTVGDFASGGGSADLSNYYTIPQVDALLALVLPPISGAEDEGKVMAVTVETVSGQQVYKYTLKSLPQIDLAYLEEAIASEVRDRVSADNNLQNQINTHGDIIVSVRSDMDGVISSLNEEATARGTKDSELESRIVDLENRPSGGESTDLTPITDRLTALEGRMSTVEDTLGYVNTSITNILTEEFGQEV